MKTYVSMWFRKTDMKIKLNILLAIAVVLIASGADAQSSDCLKTIQ
jgi:hypothetical protein